MHKLKMAEPKRYHAAEEKQQFCVCAKSIIFLSNHNVFTFAQVISVAENYNISRSKTKYDQYQGAPEYDFLQKENRAIGPIS